MLKQLDTSLHDFCHRAHVTPRVRDQMGNLSTTDLFIHFGASWIYLELSSVRNNAASAGNVAIWTIVIMD